MSHPSKHPPTRKLQRTIEVKGAHTHNLKNVDVSISHRAMTVITGLSGSGKTSLAFDTLFADWEAKYLQTFDAYTRQLMGKGTKPPVDYIKGILPSVGLKQKSQPPGPRARVGNTADIYPYLKLLYARVGTTFSPVSGEPVRRDDVTDVVNYIQAQPPKSKVWILSPLQPIEGRTLEDTLKIEQGKGFTRILAKKEHHLIEDLLAEPDALPSFEDLFLVVDRLVLPDREEHDIKGRLSESVQNAFFEGKGVCKVRVDEVQKTFSDRFEADGISFLLPSPQLFDPNNPHGACVHCHGFGRCVDVDPHKVIPDPNLSLAQGTVVPWQSISMHKWQQAFIQKAKRFPVHTPYKDLTEAEKQLLWEGNDRVDGIEDFFDFLASKPHKMQFRILQARYRGFTTCSHCQGTGLRKEVRYVQIGGKNLIEVLHMNISQLDAFFQKLSLTPRQQKISKILLKEIQHRISYLQQVGLSYLTLKRRTNTLSGGEYQRIRLARALGSSLIDTLYILDEPTVGLQPKDTDALINVFKALQEKGNTIVVVEHDENVMRAADEVIDIGPEAGSRGGEVVFQGSWEELMQDKSDRSHTVRYLTGKASIPIPLSRRPWHHALTFEGIQEHNIQDGKVSLPLEVLTVLTGVSGAGKSTLVEKVLYPALRDHLEPSYGFKKNFQSLKGDLDRVANIELVSQDALGKSSRSNPATYTKAYDGIRKLFATQPLAQERGYTPGLFSFNIPGGRCEPCMGEGTVKVEMQFTPDITVLCDSCQGRRFKQEVLDVTFQGKSIRDVLNMTVEDSITFFKNQKNDHTKAQASAGSGARLPPARAVLQYLQRGRGSTCQTQRLPRQGQPQAAYPLYLRRTHHRSPLPRHLNSHRCFPKTHCARPLRHCCRA